MVELLAAISIIALLAAFLQPALAEAKRSSIRQSCQSNLKSIGTTFHLYVADYDDTYPIAVDEFAKENPENIPEPHPALSDIPMISDVLIPFSGNERRIFRCPSDVAPFSLLSEGIGPYGTWPSVFDFNGSSYWFNSNNYYGRSASKDDQSSLTLAHDSVASWHSPYENPYGYTPSLNFLFGDGHVKYRGLIE